MIKHVTANEWKYKEICKALDGVDVSLAFLQINEILSIDPVKVLEAKARQAFGLQLGPFIMDHSALYFEQSNYLLPGCMIGVMLDVLGPSGICKTLGVQRRARARTVILLCDGKTFRYVEASIEGVVPNEPRGDNGFGWDSIFIPDGDERTFAEMPNEEKWSRTSRLMACKILLELL